MQKYDFWWRTAKSVILVMTIGQGPWPVFQDRAQSHRFEASLAYDQCSKFVNPTQQKHLHHLWPILVIIARLPNDPPHSTHGHVSIRYKDSPPTTKVYHSQENFWPTSVEESWLVFDPNSSYGTYLLDQNDTPPITSLWPLSVTGGT